MLWRKSRRGDSGIRGRRDRLWRAPCTVTSRELSIGWYRRLGLLYGPEPGNDLPALLHGKAGPGRHAVSQVALAEKPLKVSVRCGANVFAAQRRALVSVAFSVGLVALQAMVAVNERAGRNRFGFTCQRIGAGMIS